MRESWPTPGHYEIPPEPDTAVEVFWTQWGQQAGFDHEQFRSLWRDAENQYTDDLEQHNFRHAQEVLWDAMCLADQCEAHGLVVNRKALSEAALLHDAGLHRNFMHYRFESEEAYSAAILGILAPNHGLQPEDIAVGQQAILSTRAGAEPLTLEDKIMVRADLMNMSGDYESTFLPTTERLMAEDQAIALSRGKPFDPLQFKRNSIKTIAAYLGHDLSLGPFDDPKWLERPVSNLWRMIAETATEEQLPIREFIRHLGSSAVDNLLLGHFHRHPDTKS